MGDIKVTDKRMFTPDGRLREEYKNLPEEDAASSGPPEVPAPAPAPPQAEGRRSEARGPIAPENASPTPAHEAPPLELPGTPPGLGAPTFYDLVAVLADPASLYLGDVPLPDGRTAEDLEMARLHIDLLDLLRQRTAGRLAAQERAFLEDVLYRLRMRYVQKRG